MIRQRSGLRSSWSRPHLHATRSRRSIPYSTLVPMLAPSGMTVALSHPEGGGCRSNRGCSSNPAQPRSPRALPRSPCNLSSNPAQPRPPSYHRKRHQGGICPLTRGCRTRSPSSFPRKGRGSPSTISYTSAALRNLSRVARNASHHPATPTPTRRKGDGNHSTRGCNRRRTISSRALRRNILARKCAIRAIHPQASRVRAQKLVQKARRHLARRGAAANSR